MKRFPRILSLLLVLCMIVSMIPTMVYAETAGTEYVLASELKDGDKVVFVNKANNLAFSTADASNAYYRAGVSVTPADGKLLVTDEALVWTVEMTDGGFYLKNAEDKKLSVPNGYGSLNFTQEDNAVWALETATTAGCFYLKSTTAVGQYGDAKYVEWYNSYFSMYFLSSSKEDLFALELYVKQTADEKPAEGSTLSSVYASFAAEDHTNAPLEDEDFIVDGDSLTIGIMTTTDMHGRAYDWNSYTNSALNNNYLQAAVLVAQQRALVDDSIVIDNGDIMQGSALSSYNILQENAKDNPLATALRYIGYDAFGLGNHEYNYTPAIQWSFYNYLTSTDESLPGEPVDILCANVVETETGNSVFSPYKTFTYVFADGTEYTIGLIMMENMNNANWDVASHYEGCTFGRVENEEHSYVYEYELYREELEEKCDYIIVALHSGEGSETTFNQESQGAYFIANTTGIDMLITGHNHQARANYLTNKDGEKVIVMNGGGSTLAVTQLTLTKGADGKVTVSAGEPTGIALNKALNGTEVTSADFTLGDENYDGLKALLKTAFEKADAFVNAEIGTVSGEWDSSSKYYVEQTDSYDLVHKAQIWAACTDTGIDPTKNHVVSMTTPVASNGFTVGGLIKDGETSATISLRDCYSLYKYDNNTLFMIKLTGAQLMSWMQSTVQYYKVSGTTVSGYSFGLDQFYGINYEVYMGNEAGSQVVNVTYADGTPVKDTDEIYLCLSSYRLSATADSDAHGWFAATDITSDSEEVVWDATVSEKFNNIGGSVPLIIGEYIKALTAEGKDVTPGSETAWFVTAEAAPVATIETQIAATSKNMTKYGHLDLDIPADTFLETFAYGDIVTVTFTVNGTELSYDFPVCSNYDDVDTYAYLIRAVSGKDTVTMAINYGKIGVVSGVLVTDEVNSGYKVAEGVTLPIPATVTMKEAGGYAKELEIRALNRTNNREDYPELTDKEFANFRVVTTTGMGEGILYRSSSPINPSLGRNTYADAAAKAAGVKTFINLADTEAEATAYEGYAESYYSAQNHIFLGLPVAFASDEFKSGLAEGFRYIATHEGPYLVHCTEGKDRAGLTTAILECFMGATAEEVCADYVKTFRNYYNVVDGVQTDLTDEQVAYLENAIMNNLGLIFGIEDAKNADLAAEAAKFMSAIGLTDAEIAQLKANLSVDAPVTLTAYLDEDGKNMFKYGQLDVEISVEEFLQTFDYGDVVDVTFNGVTYENMPVCTNYTDVSAFELLVRAAPGYNIVTLAIQYGQIGIDSGIIVATDKGYEIAEGIEFPIEVTFTLKEKGGYAETLDLLRMTRTNNREDYPELTDEQFANFRVVTTTGMGEGILYRSSNPVNPQIGRNTYADAAAAKAGVKTFMNLADTQAEAEAYAGYSDSYYSKQNVIFLGLPAAFTSEEFKAGLANGFRFLATHEGPYLVHCTEGKDRAGLTSAILECFMGATWEEVAEDYLTTYHNYYSVIDGVQAPLTEAQETYLRNEILKYLGIIFEVEDVTAEGVDLQAEAEVYLAYIGLTKDEIAQLKKNLSVDVKDTTVTLEIFETTDIHGYLLDTSSGDEATFQYRMAYIANVINEARANAENDDVILLDSGDIYQGTPVSNLTFGNALRAAMDYMSYDAVSLGNHEFDWDVTTYAADKYGTMPAYEIGEYKGDSDIPVLAYDLIDKATGKKADFVREYTILDKGGVKVAVIGYIPDYSMDIMAAKINPYNIDENLEGLSAKVDEVIAAETPDVVLVLAHASPKYIAESLDPEKVDLVLGGHSHQISYGVADSGVTYMQGNCQAQGYANAKIVVDTATGEVTVENPTYVKITGDKTALYDTEENAAHLDSDIVAISKASWDAVKDTMQEVLGEVDQSIYRRQYIGESTNTIAGNWLTGIMLRATADQNTIIAFTNSGGIRCDLLKDEDAETRAITVGDIYTISPFCNRWYIYDLTGAELAQTVNNAFTNSNYGDQFSGMIVTYTETEGEAGPDGMPARPVKTVVSITLDNGTPVDITNDTDRIYRIVTNEYCATLPGAVTENMTPVVDINEAPVDNEAIIAVLRAEGKANDGKLALDLTERCVKAPTFTDVARGEWYYTYVENAAKLGLITGYTDGTFRPEATLTRAEAATLLYRLAGTPEVTTTASFTDLVNGWYDDAIAWAEETGIVNGFSDGTFRPDEAVTREQFVTMVWRLSGEAEATGTLEGFVDADSVQEYARPAFAWAIENGIINGITSYQWEGVRLAPQDNIKRCEAAKILT